MEEAFDESIEAEISKIEKEMMKFSDKDVDMPESIWENKSYFANKSPEDLAYIILEINQYCMSLRRKVNKLRSWSRWAYLKREEYAASALEKIDPSIGWNNMDTMAKNSPQVCIKLNKYIRKVNLLIDRYNDIDKNIEAISKTINDIKYLKVKQY